MPGTSAAIGPATGIMPFNPPGSVSRISPILSGRVRNISAVADFGMVPTPAIAKILPALVRIRMGASPPIPKCESSLADAANIAATPASTALPPL